MTKKNTKKTISTQQYLSYIVPIIIILSIVTGTLLVIDSIDISKRNLNSLLYYQKVKQDHSYDVLIYPNSQYADYEGFIIKYGESYPASIVKDINLKFDYTYYGSKLIPVKYSYELLGQIVGEYKLDNEDTKLWRKDYILLEKVEKEVNNSAGFDIKFEYPLNYALYNDEVTAYKQQMKLPITAYMLVTLKVDVVGSLDGIEIDDSKISTYRIPLNQSVFKITDEFEKEYDKKLAKTDINAMLDARKLIFGIIVIISAIFTFILNFRTIFNIKRKSNYSIKLRKIRKQYGAIIIEVVTRIKTKGYNVIDVKDFNELLDLEEELRIPIDFYEVEAGELGEFTIVSGDNIYRYTLEK